ncbi:MAG: hypothetical protein JXP36_06265 [Bacteroidales bacterium]|nr:hypothetical protein [Bacteroidales bacterium]
MKNKVIILFLVLSSLATFGQKEILVSFKTSQNDTMNLSELADSVYRISFEAYNGRKLFRIPTVLKIGDYYYLTEGSEEEKGFPTRVLQYSKEGKFLKTIEQKQRGQVYITPSEDQTFYSFSRDSVKHYSQTGEIIQSFSINKRPHQICVLNNKLWYTCSDFNSTEIIYYLYSSDTSGRNPKIIKKITEPVTDGLMIAKKSRMNVCNGKLFFTLGQTDSDRLFTIKNDNVIPLIKFEATDVSNKQMYSKSTPVLRAGQYVFKWYFNMDRELQRGLAIFDLKKNKFSNIKYIEGSEELIGGIYDDVFNTGYIDPYPNTNDNSLVFYAKNDSSSQYFDIYFIRLNSTTND